MSDTVKILLWITTAVSIGLIYGAIVGFLTQYGYIKPQYVVKSVDVVQSDGTSKPKKVRVLVLGMIGHALAGAAASFLALCSMVMLTFFDPTGAFEVASAAGALFGLIVVAMSGNEFLRRAQNSKIWEGLLPVLKDPNANTPAAPEDATIIEARGLLANKPSGFPVLRLLADAH